MVKEIYNFSIISPKLLELRNLVDVAQLIIQQSIDQKENKGTCFLQEQMGKKN